MSRARRLAAASVLAAALISGRGPAFVGPDQVAAQERIAQTASARTVAFINEPREPEFGEIFQLEVQVRVAPGMVAFLSDTMVDAASMVSAGPGTWTEAVGPGDSLDIRATYPVMGFLTGGVELPFVELWTRPVGPGETPRVLPADQFPEAERDLPGVERSVLYLGGIFVMPPAEMVGDDAMLAPRPPADVLGGNRSVWLVAALIVLGFAAAAVAWLLLAGRPVKVPAAIMLSPKDEALRELDRIRALGWHSNGRVAEFYDATTGVLRQYAERTKPREWQTALTSTELLKRLRERSGGAVVQALGDTVWTAECVKFGERRPDPGTAEADWARVRDWIAREADGS